MECYRVGGAIRDELLGLPVKDHDWVVVGGTPEQLIALGFRPVGRDFPVFLHPRTHEEYALARTERKVARGYRGFAVDHAPDVSLEDDLRRRDLTINAIARSADGRLIDPHGGVRDLRAGILRHVSDAFREDPVRVLRLARFAARFTTFHVADETLALMRWMTAHGDMDALVPERVWQEMSRGLMENAPSRMFDVLRRCGALAHVLPELDRLWGVPRPSALAPESDTGAHLMRVLDRAAASGRTLNVRVAALLHELGKGDSTPPAESGAHAATLVDRVCERLRAPTDARDLARLVAREIDCVHQALTLPPDAMLALLERLDAIRRPARVEEVLATCEIDHQTGTGMPYPAADRIRLALTAARSVDAGAVAAAGPTATIRDRVQAARLSAVSAALAGASARSD